jgi:microcystin-dependent protein
MSFNQTSAPTGWTKDTTAELDDSIMRIVTGTVGAGGATGFSTFNQQTSVGATTLATTQIPSHTHTYQNNSGSAATPTGSGSFGSGSTNTGATGGGGSHTHSVTTNIKYKDFIIAQKD